MHSVSAARYDNPMATPLPPSSGPMDYDERVGSSLQMISQDPQGRVSVQDLEKALAVIKHKPDEEVGHMVIEKLDVDKDG